MADILISKFTTQIPRVGATPATPGFAESEGQDPVAPSGTPIQYGIGAGLSLDSLNQIQLGDEDYAGNRTVFIDEWSNAGLYEMVFTNSTYDIYQSLGQFGSGSQWYLDLKNRAQVAFSEYGNDSEIIIRRYYLDGVTLKKQGFELSQVFAGGKFFAIDEINNKGIEYFSDYESNFTARSLVTKQYVDGAISGAGHNPVTIGSPANGLSIDGSQVLTIGLASTSDTGALSSTDWNTFNGKIEGSLTSGRIPFATGANTLSDDADLTWDNVNNIFSITGKANINFGTSNLLIGLNAGAVISTGNSNVGIGALSLNATTSGVSNTGIGANTLRSNITSSNNTAIGANALLNSLLGSNIAIGVNAGRYFTGINNAQNITGSIFIGNNSQAFSNTSSGEIVIGVSAVGLGNNTTVIGTTSTVATVLPAGSLWVNTTSGTNTLDVNGTARIRTISNLGSAATSVLVPSATGVVSLRTLAELASDMGVLSNIIQTVSTTGTINDLTRTGTTIVFTGVSAVTLTGLNAGTDGEEIKIVNYSSALLIIAHENTGSTDVNRIRGQVSLGRFGMTATLKYRSTLNRWVLITGFWLSDTANGFYANNNVGIGGNAQANIRTRIQSEGNTSGFTALFVVDNSGNQILNCNGTRNVYIPFQLSVGTTATPIANTKLTVRGNGTTTDATVILEASDGTDNALFIDNGQIRFLRLPTSSAGLAAGSLWNNGGVLNIV